MRSDAGRISKTLLAPLGCMVCAAMLCSVGPARAYDQAGHFYTISAGVAMIQPPLNAPQALVISFCAQLPDHADELDAVRVFRKIRKDSLGELYGWLRKDEVGRKAISIRRMVTVQQLLHGLTGGSAQEVQAVAANTVISLRAKAAADPANYGAWCAVGFALHLFGDSHAHREMGKNGNDPDSMYTTGKGHAADLTYPDRPLCAQFNRGWFNPWGCEVARAGRLGRFASWENYWKTALPKLAPATPVNPTTIDGVATRIIEIGKDASSLNDWREKKMRQTLDRNGAGERTGEFLSQQGSGKPCKEVLNLALASGGPLAGSGIPAFKCSDAWNAYYEVVTAEFEKEKNARKPPRTDFKEVYTSDVWTAVEETP